MGKIMPSFRYMLPREPKKIRRSFVDVKKGTIEGNILSLRELEKSFFSLSKTIRLTISAGFVFLLIASFTVVFSPRASAQSVVFAPTSCLGGWENPGYAQNRGETTSNEEEDQFTVDNSSVLKEDTRADLYCGNFEGVIPKDTKPTAIVLSLLWTTKQGENVESISGQSFASSTQTILDATSSATTTFTLIENTMDRASSTTQDSILPERPEEAVPVEDTPTQSWYEKIPTFISRTFIVHAYAEEIGESVTTDASSTIEALQEEEISTSTQSNNPGEFLRVLYTLDGTTWNSLGTLGAAQLKYITFAIPTEATSTWKDFSKLQIRIESLTTLDPNPAVYLDGMSLQVDYEGYVEEVPKGNPTLDKSIAHEKDMVQSKSIVPNSYLALYRIEDSVSSYVYGLEIPDTGIRDIDISTLPPGNYIVINTKEIGLCNSLSLNDCRKNLEYIGEASFEVVPTKEKETPTVSVTKKIIEEPVQTEDEAATSAPSLP